MRKPLVWVIGLLAMFLTSCSSGYLFVTDYSTIGTTKGVAYRELYKESPTSIVIMPPINKTANVDAKLSFYTSLYKPLCEKGYYVCSPYLMMEMLQAESAYDSELFINGNLSKFHEVLGVDAAMFTIIKRWEKSHLIDQIEVEVEFVLKSTHTNNVLYKRSGDVVIDMDVFTGTDDYSAIFDFVVSVAQTVTTDQIVAGRKCTYYVLSDMPAGKYSPEFRKDSEEPAGIPHITAVSL